MAVRVLIAQKSKKTRDAIRQHLECIRCHVVAEAQTAMQAVDLFRTVRPDLVTLDPDLKPAGQVDALCMFRLLRRELPTASVVMVNEAGSHGNLGPFLDEGALDCVVEPLCASSLRRMWKRLLALYPELSVPQ